MLNLVDFPLFTVNPMDENMSHVTENGLDKGREEKSLPLQDDSLEIRPNSPEEMTSHEPMQQHSVIDEVGRLDIVQCEKLRQMERSDDHIVLTSMIHILPGQFNP